MKYVIYRIKALILHEMWAWGLVRGVYDNTKKHKVSGQKYFYQWPKKRHKPPMVEIKDFPMRYAFPDEASPEDKGGQCHAQKDGDCIWEKCPQLRDGEPQKTGRHCPIDTWDDYD